MFSKIKSLISKKAKIIIISHLGRPKGKIVSELTLKPIAKKLAGYLDQNVIFFLTQSPFNFVLIVQLTLYQLMLQD